MGWWCVVWSLLCYQYRIDQRSMDSPDERKVSNLTDLVLSVQRNGNDQIQLGLQSIRSEFGKNMSSVW